MWKCERCGILNEDSTLQCVNCFTEKEKAAAAVSQPRTEPPAAAPKPVQTVAADVKKPYEVPAQKEPPKAETSKPALPKLPPVTSRTEKPAEKEFEWGPFLWALLIVVILLAICLFAH